MLHHINYKEIDPASCDTDIAMKVAAILLKEKPRPSYRLSINHDVRAAACATNKPRTGRCPLPYEWALKDEVGIETRDRGIAWLWVVGALTKGYTVTRHYPISQGPVQGTSIEAVRRRAEFERRPRTAADDDIPF